MELPAGPSVATVGSVRITEDMVAELAKAEALSRHEALERLVMDVLAAQEFGRSHPSEAAGLQRLGSAKALLAELRSAGVQQGPPTEAEVNEVTESKFWEASRPRMVQVVHAVVLSKEESPGALALAETIAGAVGTDSEPTVFRQTVKSLPVGDWEVKVEALPPVSADGRTFDPDRPPPVGPAVGQLVREFAEGACRLQRIGEVSPVVRSSFGYHVMVLVEQWAPQILDLEARSRLYADEIYENRAKRLREQLLAMLSAEVAPSRRRAAISLMTALEPVQ